jgi:hypothetical protein
MVWNQKRKFHESRLRELKQLGLALPIAIDRIDNRPSEILVEQAASYFICTITDLPDGRTEYFIWLSLVAARPGTRLHHFRIEPPWPDSNFEPLPSFEASHFGEYYVLPGGLDCPREDVLNFHFGKNGWRLPSTRIEGVLCGISRTPIPEAFHHGALIPVGVRFFDRDGQPLAGATVHLWADRWSHRSQGSRSVPADAPSAEPGVLSNVAASDESLRRRSILCAIDAATRILSSGDVSFNDFIAPREPPSSVCGIEDEVEERYYGGELRTLNSDTVTAARPHPGASSDRGTQTQ